jgi:6-phosphogluconolactonase (cycloisomerase 2 family)
MLYIGGYTTETGGTGRGLTTVRADGPGQMTAVAETAVPSPSFLAAHPWLPLLYAVLERDEGGVAIFSVDPADTKGDSAGPVLLAERPSGGSLPCHLAVDPEGSWLTVANYGDGTLSAFRLGLDGLPLSRPLLFRNEGCGPHPERQRGPHAHQAVFGPGGVLHVTDLGTDEIRRFLPWMTQHPDGPVRLAPGTGPRHLARRGGHWYVAGELDGTVAVYDDTWRETCRVPASGAAGQNQPSHIEVSADGRHVYVANRGPDTLAAFAVAGERIEPVAETPTGGSWPRHFAIAGDRIYVANERSHALTALALAGGIPRPTGEELAIPSPTCVLVTG